MKLQKKAIKHVIDTLKLPDAYNVYRHVDEYLTHDAEGNKIPEKVKTEILKRLSDRTHTVFVQPINQAKEWLSALADDLETETK